MINDDDNEKMKSESVISMWEFHMEDSQKYNSTWNFFSMGLIEGLPHIQIMEGIPIFLWIPDPRVCKTPLGPFWCWPCKTWRQPEENWVICWHFCCLSKIGLGLGSKWGLDWAFGNFNAYTQASVLVLLSGWFGCIPKKKAMTENFQSRPPDGPEWHTHTHIILTSLLGNPCMSTSTFHVEWIEPGYVSLDRLQTENKLSFWNRGS